MGKIYLFNPQPFQSSVPALSARVNGDTKQPYQIRFAQKSQDFTPFSVSGNRTGGSEPHGNDFALKNTMLVQGIPPDRFYDRLDFPQPPPVTADLILYIFQRNMLLFGTDGRFLQKYLPAPSASRENTAEGAKGIRRRRERVQASPGTVFVFNVFAEAMNPFGANGKAAGQIGGWSKGGPSDPPLYTPFVLRVGRVLNQSESPGHIANGRNEIFVAWASKTGSFALTIDGNSFPISQDMLLFVLHDNWFLSDQFGVERNSGRVE